MKSFGSDNHAGVSNVVFDFLKKANDLGHLPSYGEDPYTKKVDKLISDHFDGCAAVYYVFNGTGANVLSLRSVLKPYEGAIVTDCSHLVCDECGAPEASGIKLFPVENKRGKLTPEMLEKFTYIENDQHWVQPKLVSITQSTEAGTLYTPSEIRGISAFCKKMGWVLHMDGARISNAAVSLGLSLKEISKDLGVDILSLGGTKNGLMGAEAVVVFNEKLTEGFKFYRKQRLQLSSKMRYLAAQFDAFFHEDLWKSNAETANSMAGYLYQKLADSLGKDQLYCEVEANEVFVHLPNMELVRSLQKKWDFHVWDESTNLVRFVCSFDATKEDVDALVADLDGLL